MRFALAALIVALSLPALAESHKPPPPKKAGGSAKKADSPAAMAAPKPDPMLDAAFGSAVGTWNCNGTWKMPDGKEMKATSTLKIQKELKGYIYAGTEKVKGTKEMPASESHMHWGMDPAEKGKILQVGYDDMGSAWRATGGGWEGDTMTSAGTMTMMGMDPMKTRTRVTRGGGGKTLTMVFEGEQGGKFVEMGRQECKK